MFNLIVFDGWLLSIDTAHKLLISRVSKLLVLAVSKFWPIGITDLIELIEAETKLPPSPDYIFKCIFLNENISILIKISLKFAPEGRINNIPALVQIMAWRRPGHKPLSEPVMVSLLTHICVTWPQWVDKSIYSYRSICHMAWKVEVYECTSAR